MLLFAAVLLLLTVAACEDGGRDSHAEGIPTQIPETLYYTALGDSLATGAGASTSYVVEYADWLAETTGSRVEVSNLAEDGWTTRDLLDALDSDASMREAVSAAHVVTWDIGGNDLLAALGTFLQGTCGGTDGEACLRDAVDTVLTRNEVVMEQLATLRGDELTGALTLELYLPFMDDHRVAPYLPTLRPHLDAVNDGLTERARRHGVPVARIDEAFHGTDRQRDPVEDGLIAPDGVHPSDRGHEVIAAELAELGLHLGDPGPPAR